MQLVRAIAVTTVSTQGSTLSMLTVNMPLTSDVTVAVPAEQVTLTVALARAAPTAAVPRSSGEVGPRAADAESPPPPQAVKTAAAASTKICKLRDRTLHRIPLFVFYGWRLPKPLKAIEGRRHGGRACREGPHDRTPDAMRRKLEHYFRYEPEFGEVRLPPERANARPVTRRRWCMGTNKSNPFRLMQSNLLLTTATMGFASFSGAQLSR